MYVHIMYVLSLQNLTPQGASSPGPLAATVQARNEGVTVYALGGGRGCDRGAGGETRLLLSPAFWLGIFPFLPARTCELEVAGVKKTDASRRSTNCQRGFEHV